MGYVYDTRFKVGFVVTITAFVLIALALFVLAGWEYDRMAETKKFFPVGGRLAWGFPFYWSGADFSSFLANLFVRPIGNILIILGFGLVGGFIARSFRSRHASK